MKHQVSFRASTALLGSALCLAACGSTSTTSDEDMSVNSAPTVSAGSDQSVVEGVSVQLDVTRSPSLDHRAG